MPRLTRLVCRLATSISSRTPVRSTSSARNCPSVSSSSGQASWAAMFSRASGTGNWSWAIRTFSATTRRASRERGTGSRWPASRPPARTNARCSVTTGEPSSAAVPASLASRAGSGRSAPPRPSPTPCGTTVRPRSSRIRREVGRWPSQMFSATTSTQSRPGCRSTTVSISLRQPRPTPSRRAVPVPKPALSAVPAVVGVPVVPVVVAGGCGAVRRAGEVIGAPPSEGWVESRRSARASSPGPPGCGAEHVPGPSGCQASAGHLRALLELGVESIRDLGPNFPHRRWWGRFRWKTGSRADRWWLL